MHKGVIVLKKCTSVLLIVLSVLSLLGALAAIALINCFYPTSTAVEWMYYSIGHGWVFWLFMRIPIACVLYGALQKQKKNIIVGVVFLFLLFAFSCVSIVRSFSYSTDVRYLDRLESRLDIEFPNGTTIVTEDWTERIQTSSDGWLLRYDSVARFNNSTEVRSFLDNLDAEKWQTEQESISDMLPATFRATTAKCEYFLLYCFETKTFSEAKAVPQYTYVCMALDEEESALYITEYTRK